MKAEVKVPEVGESITEGFIAEWLRGDGALVQVDEPLFVLETDKITQTVTAGQAGRLARVVEAGATVEIGQVVATIDTAAAAEATAASTPAAAAPGAVAAPAPAAATPPRPPRAHPAPPLPRPPQTDGPPASAPAGLPQARAKLDGGAAPVGVDELAPAVRRLVEEHRLDPAAISSSGRGGRLTKEDVLSYLARARAETTPGGIAAQAAGGPAPAPPGPPPEATPAAAVPAAPPAAQAPQHRQTRTRMTPLRHRIAERLVQAQQTAAILTTFNEVDMSRTMALRSRFKAPFREKHDVGLGFMSFFVKAVVEALRAVPQLNAQIQGDEIVHNHYYDIGVAVGTARGLVVPVVRDADQRSFAAIERTIVDLAERARAGTLTLPELTGGVFTISNGGVYGSLLSTPILNPPQSGILGMHGIKQRPVVVDGEIVARPMMYLALSYDHRIVDGEQAVSFLRRVVECIEDPERLLLEV